MYYVFNTYCFYEAKRSRQAKPEHFVLINIKLLVKHRACTSYKDIKKWIRSITVNTSTS